MPKKQMLICGSYLWSDGIDARKTNASPWKLGSTAREERLHKFYSEYTGQGRGRDTVAPVCVHTVAADVVQ